MNRLIITGLLAGVLVVGSARSSFAAPPPYGVAGAKAVKVEALNGTTDIVSPTTGGPYPLIVASHGFSASGANQVGWAKHFASYGFVVAVPSFPSPLSPDTQLNAGVISGLVNDLRQASTAATRNILATAKVGLEGHSAGGLATTVAAEKLGAANVGAVVLFDPVDKDDVGKAAYAKICSPLLDIFSAPSSCNTQASWRAFATTTGAELIGFAIVGSTHCDGENADRGALCGFACGGAASPDRQKVYASYATALFLSELTGDAAAKASISAANVAADTTVAQPLRATRSAACAGSSSGDAGVGDAGSSSSGSSGSSSSGSSGTPSSSSSSSGNSNPGPESYASPAANNDGCSMIGMRSANSMMSFTALAFVAWLLRRRRR